MTKTQAAAPRLKTSRTRKTKAATPAPETAVAVSPPSVQTPTGKLAILAGLLRRPEGAGLADMTAATGWQAHSVRGALAGALKKKHALEITSEKLDGVRVYRVKAGAPA